MHKTTKGIPATGPIGDLTEIGIDELEGLYMDAAVALQQAVSTSQNSHDETYLFIELRDELRSRPEFSGRLPVTYWTGSDLDPET